ERGRLTSFRQDSRSRSRIMPQTESCRPLERVASLGRGKLAFQGSALLRKVNLIGIPGSVRCFATGPEFSSMPDEQLQLNVVPDSASDLIPTVNLRRRAGVGQDLRAGPPLVFLREHKARH